MSSDPKHPDFCRRKALKVAVSALCSEVGFSHAEDSALETLTEMLQSFISEAGRSTQAYCELAGRTEPLVSDVSIALIEMGTDIMSLEAYSKRQNKSMFMPPVPANPPNQPKNLQAGPKRPLPPYIPDYFPAFPDSHTYIHTPTNKPPATEYQLIREKAASQKRDVECALTKFIAKTGDTETLFSDDPYAFPLIANKTHSLPYLDALLLKEEDLDAADQEESNEKKEQKKPPQQPKKEEEPIKPEKTEPTEPPANPEDPKTPVANNGTPSKTDAVKLETEPQTPTTAETADGQIDNPYLREIKMPKLKGGGKRNYMGAIKW